MCSLCNSETFTEYESNVLVVVFFCFRNFSYSKTLFVTIYITFLQRIYAETTPPPGPLPCTGESDIHTKTSSCTTYYYRPFHTLAGDFCLWVRLTQWKQNRVGFTCVCVYFSASLQAHSGHSTVDRTTHPVAYRRRHLLYCTTAAFFLER